jgi:hypothetical protein
MGGSTERLPRGRKTKHTVVSDEEGFRIHTRYREEIKGKMLPRQERRRRGHEDHRTLRSVALRASIEGVHKEGIIAACLSAFMIFLFLGSPRSTLIIAASMPLRSLAQSH